MGRRRAMGRVAWSAWMLRCLAPRLAHAGGDPQSDLASVADEVILVQASAQRHQEPPAPVPASAPPLLDADNCPTDDPKVALRGSCQPREAVREFRERSCRAAEDGEKEVYFMRHAEPVCCLDCGLNDKGVAVCQGMREHNKLLRNGPLSEDERVQVVYTSPATRALQTALAVFSGTGAAFRIEPLLVESGSFDHCARCGQAAINASNNTELLGPYNELFGDLNSVPRAYPWNQRPPWKDWPEDPEGRADNFTQKLLSTPERYVAVVSHFYLMGHWKPELLGLHCMSMGKVVVKAILSKDGTWRRASDAPCQGRRRRWDWGNYRRQARADVEGEE